MTDISKPNDDPLRLTQAEATVLRELGRRQRGESQPRLAGAYRRVLELSRSDDPIDSILTAHLVREVLSASPGALGIELPRERLQYENEIGDLSRKWPADERAGDPPAVAITALSRLLDDHDRAAGRARAGPRALLAREDVAHSGFVPDPSIDRWISLSRRGSGLAHRLRSLDRDLPSAAEARRLADELTATLLAAIAPFYIGIGEIDALIAIETPTEADAQHVADLLRTPAQYAYFFDRAHEQWLRPLASVHRLLISPPDLVDVGGGYVRVADWPQGRFLARVAPSDPDLVADIVGRVRASTNPGVLAQIVKVALALPVPHAARLVEPIRARMSVALAIEYAGLDAASLAQRLARAGRADAATELLIAAIDSAIASPRDIEWHLEHLLGDPIDAIVQAGGEIVYPLRLRLVNALDQAGPLRPYSTTLLHRIDLRPRYRADTIWFLANALFRTLLASPLESARVLTSEFLTDPERTLARVALAAVAQRPDLVDKSDIALLETAQLDDANTTRHEFRRALYALWEAASLEARAALLSYAESADEATEISERLAAEQVTDAPRPDELRRVWRSNLLFRIRDVIQNDWLDRFGPLDATEDEGPAEPTVETVTLVSPVTEDELATMKPDAVIGVLHEWASAEPRRFDVPGPEGLAIAVASTFVSRIQEFSHLGPNIAKVHPRFVGAITSAIERSLREDRLLGRGAAISFALSLGEALILGNAADVLSSDIKRDIAEIIALGAHTNDLDEAGTVTASRILSWLLQDIDPRSTSEESDAESRRDIGVLALSMRGAATTGMIELLLLSRRAERSDLADELAGALRAVIGVDYTRSVRAALGMRLPWLLDQDADHSAEWLRLLFGADVPDVARATTWNAYLLYSRFFATTASRLADQYAVSVARLDARPEDDRKRPPDRDERLGIHVAMAHLIAMPAEGDGEWLTDFYERTQDWVRARVTRWIAEQAAADGAAPEVRSRARTFLRNRIGRDRELMEAEELRAIGWIARARDSEDEVLEMIVLPVLERTGGATDDETGIADLIARRSAANPLVAAKALRLLVAGDPWHALPHIAAQDLRHALEVLTVSGDVEAREISKTVVHTLGALGFLEYRDLLPGDEHD